MIVLPDGVLLQKIITRNIHFDIKSLEVTTNIIKPKYKLTGNILTDIGIYCFFILTKNKYTCRQDLLLCILQKDLLDKKKGHLKEKYSYTDITKYEILDKEEILSKIKDDKNGFECVAKLRAKKYKILKWHCYKAKKTKRKPSRKDILLIDLALMKVTEEKLKKLQLM